jgi:type II secretory pathway component GspD/PulD (secretin)
MKYFLLLLLCVSLQTTANAQQMVTEVISLGYRSVSEIIPVVRPLVSPGGSVSGLQGQLVVTATPQQLAQLRKVLSTLDKSPVRLLISVRRGNSSSGKQSSASVQGRIGNVAINNGSVRAGDAIGVHQKDQNYLAVQANSSRQDEEMNITQRVQVLEGREAHIYSGEEIPVRNRGAVAGPGGVYHYNSTEFYPAVTGFYAIPRINGDEVFLEINSLSRQRNNLRIKSPYAQQGRQSAAVSNVSTTVGGKLGEWIAIGKIEQSGESRQSGIAAISRRQLDASSQVYVRVEKLQDRH